jgi:hypothetical protein
MEITDQVHSHREEREPPSDPEADQKRVWVSIFISHNETPLPNFNLKRKFDHFPLLLSLFVWLVLFDHQKDPT